MLVNTDVLVPLFTDIIWTTTIYPSGVRSAHVCYKIYTMETWNLVVVF
jgi:hypothetical protein